MKIDKNQKLHLIAEKADCSALRRIEYKSGRLTATDGKILASVMVTDYNKDRPATIPTEAFRDANKNANKKLVSLSIGHDGIITVKRKNGEYKDYHNKDTEGMFPDWEAVIPEQFNEAKGAFRVTLDAELLLRLSKAIGAEENIVTLTVYPDQVKKDVTGTPSANGPVKVDAKLNLDPTTTALIMSHRPQED